MLQEVMEFIHNYFIKSVQCGRYEISNGTISLPFLQEGQRFWITNSVFNDGVYTYRSSGIMNDDDNAAAGLTDETWAGTICALAVPPAVIALSEEISQWVAKYGEAMNSPYTSENVIGVYSYTKKQGGNGESGADPSSWQGVFGSRLNRWRKVTPP